jgi:drug/metabolite transporter (DMT)-like permease
VVDVKKSVDSPPIASSTHKSAEGPTERNLNVLFLVPIVWASYTPVVKSVYSTANLIPPPVLVFNLLSYMISLSTLVLAASVVKSVGSRGIEDNIDEDNVTIKKDDVVETGGRGEAMIGAELGLYLFGGSTLQVFGIQEISAMKAALLIQCTTIVVPFLEAFLFRKRLGVRTWGASAVALLGVLVITVDDPVGVFSGLIDGSSLSSANALFSKGDLYVFGAVLFYSMHVVRLSQFAAQTEPLRLARYKSGTELVAATVVVSTAALASSGAFGATSSASGLGSLGADITGYFDSLRTLPSLSSQTPVALGILWNGAIATALTTFLQTVGQRTVSGTTANVIYSSQPVWASMISYFFLHESVSVPNLVGAVLLALAVLIAATDTQATD